MHVVTGCVIRDRVWIIRRQRATSGIRNGSRVPRDLQGHPARLNSPLASISIAGREHSEIESCSETTVSPRKSNEQSRLAKLIRAPGWHVEGGKPRRGGSVPRNNTSRRRVRRRPGRLASKSGASSTSESEWRNSGSEGKEISMNFVKIPPGRGAVGVEEKYRTKFSKLKRRIFKVASGEKFQ